MKALILACALAATGCATTFLPTEGGSTQDFNVAKWQCERATQRSDQASAEGTPGFVAVAMLLMTVASVSAQESAFRSCMSAAGWAKQ